MTVLEVTARTEGAVRLVRVEGEVDALTAPKLSEALLDGTEPGQVLVADLSGVWFLGSAGLSALTAAALAVPTLRVVAPAHTARRSLELSGLLAVLDVYETVDEARADLETAGE